MRNFKTIIALLLSIVMIFSLVACGAGDDKDDKKSKKDKEKTEQTDSAKDTEKNDDKETSGDEDTNESGKNPDNVGTKEENLDDYSIAQLIVGKWEAKIDFGEVLAEIIGGEEIADYFDFKDVYYYFEMSFTKDGEVTVSASAEELAEKLPAIIAAGYPAYAEDNGITMDEVYENLGTDEEHFGEVLVDYMGLEEFTRTETGEYIIDGNEIVVDNDGLAVEFRDVNTFVVEAESFGLGTDDVVFERQGKFNPPDADEVEDNVVSDDNRDEVASKDPEDLIIGEWRSYIDVTELLGGSFIESMGDAGECFKFDDMYYIVELVFDADGEATKTIYFNEAFEVYLDGIIEGFPVYAEYMGTTMEEIYDGLGTDEDNFREALIEEWDLDDDSYVEIGEYTIEDDIIVVDGHEIEFEISGSDVLYVDADGIGLSGLDTVEDMIKFERQ